MSNDKSVSLALVPPAGIVPNSQAIAEYLSEDSRKFVLETDEDLQLATDIINDIAARIAAVEAIRTAVTQPINAGLRTFNSFFKPFQDSAKAARELFDDKIRDYTERRAARARAAEAALQKAIETQDAGQATAAIHALVPAPRASGLTLVDGWDYEEQNHDIVPTQLTVTDRRLVMAEIRRQVTAGETEPRIGGLRIFKRAQVKATG